MFHKKFLSMVFLFIILGIISLMLIVVADEQLYCWRYHQKVKHLNDQNLQLVTRDLYDELDDRGWRWSKALKYRTAKKELNKRGLSF